MRLGGITEVAEALGVSRQRVSQLRTMAGFPDPVGEIAAGQVWNLDEIEHWGTSSLRRSSGRPSRAQPAILGDRYRLEPVPLASGGFADVYRATDLKRSSSKRDAVVAVKILRELVDEEVRRRFLRELRIVAELNHPHIVPILDQGEDDGHHLWYTMPLAKSSLADQVDRFVGDDERIHRVMRQLCDALAFVHERGVFHRDLKPANVLLMASDTWAIADFGLAREADRRTTALTSTLQGVGTFFYAAPEAWRSAKTAVATADIFSLGKVLLELTTGALPHDGAEPTGRFRPVIAKAIKYRPDQRYQSVADMWAAIDAAALSPQRWNTHSELADELRDRIRGEHLDVAALGQLIDWVFGAESPDDAARELGTTIPYLTRTGIEWLWTNDPDTFRSLVETYATVARGASWDFGFCDTIADFFDRAVQITDDDVVLTAAIEALVQIGHGHNRWHVRDVAVSILQGIRSGETAVVALDALRGCSAAAISWTLSSFAVRSLHPTLRLGLTKLLEADDN